MASTRRRRLGLVLFGVLFTAGLAIAGVKAGSLVTIRVMSAKVMKAPKFIGPAAGSVSRGDQLTIAEVKGDWYRVTGNGGPVIIDDRHMPYHKGKNVDPSDGMEGGEKFANVDQFKQLLLKDKPLLARALATKLITYGTGRAPQAGDQDQVEAIVKNIAAKDYGLRSLIHEIVQSELFRNK